MKKSNAVVGQKSLLSFFTKAPTSAVAKAPEIETIHKELVKPLMVKEINTGTHSLTYSLTHLTTYSLTHSLTHSLSSCK